MLKITSREWLEDLEALGIPCGPVNSIDDVSRDPQILHRDMVKEIPHPRLGKVKGVGTPIKLSRSVTGPSSHAPGLGEHTAKVLQDLLNISQEDISRLKDEHVI